MNAKGAQLIFSTHDTSILNQEVFRRDQIWFCERNSQTGNLGVSADGLSSAARSGKSRALLPRWPVRRGTGPSFFRSYDGAIDTWQCAGLDIGSRDGGPQRESYDRVLIVCEGKKTEPSYFGDLLTHYRLSMANIEIVGSGD